MQYYFIFLTLCSLIQSYTLFSSHEEKKPTLWQSLWCCHKKQEQANFYQDEEKTIYFQVPENHTPVQNNNQTWYSSLYCLNKKAGVIDNSAQSEQKISRQGSCITSILCCLKKQKKGLLNDEL